MGPPTTRSQKRSADEDQRQGEEGEGTAKRFRGKPGAEPNDDNLVEPIIPEKIESESEREEEPEGVGSDLDREEELEQVSTENENQDATLQYHSNNDKTEKEPVGGEGSTSEHASAPAAPNSTEKKRSLDELTNLVFCSEEEDMVKIRRMIIGHVIGAESEKDILRRNLKSVRLVSKSWLLDSNKILLECGKPFCNIFVGGWNSLNPSPEVQRTGGKLLDRFTSVMTSSTRLDAQLPPISLHVFHGYFHEENHLSFSKFLTGCATGLMKLQLELPIAGDVMTLLFPGVNFYFPNLQTLAVTFIRSAQEVASGPNLIALPFIQSILSGTQNLKMFNFVDTIVPRSIQYLSFPLTITTLDVSSFKKNSDFETLLKFDLPNLRTLSFNINNETYSKGLISRILKKFRVSLRELAVYQNPGFVRHPPTNSFQFPLMKKLEKCTFRSEYAELREGHPPLQQKLPNLKTLILECRTTSQLEKWIETSTFATVTKLYLGVVKEDRLPSFGRAFPNVQDLRLSFAKLPEKGDLDQVFVGMTQIKKLSWFGTESDPDKIQNDKWASILTGIPLRIVRALGRHPEFLQNFELRNPIQTSIVNLRELEQLSLSAFNFLDGKFFDLDVAFQYGFLHMPKLKTLRLCGDFKASDEMAQVWMDRGGCILNE